MFFDIYLLLFKEIGGEGGRGREREREEGKEGGREGIYISFFFFLML